MRGLCLSIALAAALAACKDDPPKAPAKTTAAGAPTAPAAAPPRLRVEATEPRMATQVGKRESSEILTTGKGGMLVFGPYAKYPPGNYQVVLYGRLIEGSDEGGWLETAGGKGASVFAKVPIRKSGAEKDVLAKLSFKLDRMVDDLEVRVGVTPATRLAIKSYELGPGP